MDMLQSLGMSKDLIADLLINIVSIIVLYLVVKKLAYNPVKKFLDARTERVEAEKAEASKNLSEATEMKEKYDELLKDSENAKADAIKEGDRVLVIDDLLATGGTAVAACNLVKKVGGDVVAAAFIIELDPLKGREKIEAKGVKVVSMLNYDLD